MPRFLVFLLLADRHVPICGTALENENLAAQWFRWNILRRQKVKNTESDHHAEQDTEVTKHYQSPYIGSFSRVDKELTAKRGPSRIHTLTVYTQTLQHSFAQ